MAMQRSVAAAALLVAGMLAQLWSPQPASGEPGSPGDGFDAITDGDPPVEVPFFGEPVIVPGERPQEARPKPPEARPKPQADKPDTPKPRAEKPPKPEPRQHAEAKPKPRSNRLEIPADAAQKRDLSFLEGCWYFDKNLDRIDAPGGGNLGMSQDYYCFDKRGRGRFFTRMFKFNKRFSTYARARFGPNGELFLEHPNLPTLPGVTRLAMTTSCRGREAGTVCRTYAPGARWLPKQGTTRLGRTP
jgi:hypothetical protein